MRFLAKLKLCFLLASCSLLLSQLTAQRRYVEPLPPYTPIEADQLELEKEKWMKLAFAVDNINEDTAYYLAPEPYVCENERRMLVYWDTTFYYKKEEELYALVFFRHKPAVIEVCFGTERGSVLAQENLSIMRLHWDKQRWSLEQLTKNVKNCLKSEAFSMGYSWSSYYETNSSPKAVAFEGGRIFLQREDTEGSDPFNISTADIKLFSINNYTSSALSWVSEIDQRAPTEDYQVKPEYVYHYKTRVKYFILNDQFYIELTETGNLPNKEKKKLEYIYKTTYYRYLDDQKVFVEDKNLRN